MRLWFGGGSGLGDRVHRNSLSELAPRLCTACVRSSMLRKKMVVPLHLINIAIISRTKEEVERSVRCAVASTFGVLVVG